jgi:type IV pilus assembly protein PilY1
LVRYILGNTHQLFVDGTPMVRDIWVDGSDGSSPDNTKQATEFHTVAILGEREGGREYFALDVTNPTNPVFLWEWPVAGTTEALSMGETWNDLGPAAPPIGPIAEYKNSGSFQANGKNATERYIVAVGGGFDPAYIRGRGVYFLDAWTGTELYRFSIQDSPGSLDPRSHLFPVAAPVTMIDANADGLFDTAVVGDTGGTLWTISMLDPGKVPKPGQPPGPNNLYGNWFGARAFTEFNTSPYWHRSPFFQRAVAGVLPSGSFRVLTGSGDRFQIKDPNGGTCGLANLGACLRQNCSVNVASTNYRIGAAPEGSGAGHFFNSSWSFTAGALEPSYNNVPDSVSDGDLCSDTVDGNMSYTIDCGGGPATTNAIAYCDWGAGLDGGSECPVDTGEPPGVVAGNTPGTLEYTKFYSIELFDNGSRAQFSTATAASTYDSAALTDASLINATDGGVSTAAGAGYYIQHINSADERTSSSALLLGGCVIWNTLQPNPTQQLTCGGALPFDTAYLYQADAITGAIQCGSAGSGASTATKRFVTSSAYSAPQQPAPVVAVSPTGQVALLGISIDPGSSPTSLQASQYSINKGPVQWLEVPRKVHDCRHTGANCQ